MHIQTALVMHMHVRRTPPISFKITEMMLFDLLNMNIVLPLNAVKNFSRYMHACTFKLHR